MSSIPQTTDNGNNVSDFATKFMKRFHLGRLLFKCNAGKEKGIPVMDIFRFLFCMMFSEEEIIRIYGKRWDIEVFFKACKSYLNLVKEYRGISYDAMTARLWNISTSPKLEDFTASFIQRLPKYMQEALEREETAA